MQSAIWQSSIGSGAEGNVGSRWSPKFAGDVFDMSRPAMDVEVVLGFRPGVDQLKLPMVGRLAFREAGGDVVISHKGGEIVLQGVTLVELANGLEAH